MRIALFSGNYNYIRDGANQALNRLVGWLEGRGHAVRVYSPVTATPAFEPAGTLVPVPSVALPVRTEFRLALGLPAGIRRDIERFAPDIVHVSAPDVLGTRALSFARRRGLPAVASLHTRFETYPAFYGLAWARPLVEAHLRRFYRRCDHVLAPTDAAVAELRSARGDDHAGLWSRGIDRQRFDPARRDPAWRRANGWSDEDVVVLFFGRLVAEKGIEEFVAVVRRLQRRSSKVRVLAVGEGPARGAFEALPGAIVAGHLDGDVLGTAVASADLLLHPSTTEAFGNVVVEAMASGLPVVAATTSPARVMIADGLNGLLYPSGDIDAAERAIASLADDPAARRAMGAAARAASAAYSWEAASRQVEDAYRQVLARRGEQEIR